MFSFDNGFNNHLNIGYDKLNFSKEDNINNIESKLDSFDINSLINENLSKDTDYMLLDNKLVYKMIIEIDPNLEDIYNNSLYFNNEPFPHVEYESIKIQNLKDSKESLNSTFKNDVLEYKNPNSKKVILEGKNIGKKFNEVKKDEVLLMHSENTTSGESLKDIIENTFKDTDATIINEKKYYPNFIITYSGLELVLGFNLEDDLKLFRVIPIYNGITYVGVELKEVKNMFDPNKEFTISKDEDKALANKVIRVLKLKPEVGNLTQYKTLKKCFRFKLDNKNSQLKDEIYFVRGNEILFCKDDTNYTYAFRDFYEQKTKLELYNYDAIVEKTNFTKDLIRSKLSSN